MKKIFFFVTDEQRLELALSFHRNKYFKVYFIALKLMDKLDILSKNEDIPEDLVYDLPTLYKDLRPEFDGLSIEQVSEAISNSELENNVRASNVLISYNYGRSMMPTENYRELLFRIWAEHKYIKNLIEIIRPDAIMGELTRSYMVIAYDMAKMINIPYIHILEFPKSYYGSSMLMLTDEKGRNHQFHQLYKDYKLGKKEPSLEAQEFARNIASNIRNPKKFTSTFLLTNKDVFLQKAKNRIKNFDNLKKAYKTDNSYYPDKASFGNPVSSVLNRFVTDHYKVWKGKKISIISKRGLRQRPNNEKYVYMPLHYYPELVSNVWGNDFIHFYYNELHLIQHISKNLPTGHYLYVKEHMPMIGRRSEEFYKVILGLYNVRLFHPLANNFDLIDHASCVVTTASTTGFEAFVFNKPVLTFQGSYYAGLGKIKQVDLNVSLHKQILQTIEDGGSNKEDITKALEALYDICLKFELSNQEFMTEYHFLFSEKSVKNLCQYIIEYMELNVERKGA